MRLATNGLAALLVVTLPGVSSANDLLARAPQLEDVVTSALEEFHVPGAAVGIWTENGQWTKALGLADVAASRPVKLRDHFALRSVTKSFVVTVLLQLIAESNGSIGLDDPIGKYLSGVPNGARITLRELANMTSGLYDYSADPRFHAALGADLTREWTTDELLAFAFDDTSHSATNFEPGARYQYCNTNTLVLGKLIEVLTGATFDQVLRQRVLVPLVLPGTKYLHGARLPRPFASGYQGETDAGSPEPVVVSFSGLGFAGAMVSTLRDLGVWGPALATGSLLPPELQKQRFEAHSTSADPGSPVYDAYGLGMGQVAGWWGHTGEGLGYEAAVFHQIERNETVAILLNGSDTSDVPVRIFCRLLTVLGEAPAAGSGSVCAPGDDGVGRLKPAALAD
ncbi:serine hydrolase domain-containing protein [Rhodopila sp.]|uniref:serine hydrolase domain-containing protein n=1 Tax=Rhodopila sp. TaxID=2480087 RepID=UPI003D0C50C8